ncbi:hypothetical protein [Reyranella sp.]|uniref:hypothetical protein n=1 Tax=Reyranella sp. TaxID=1929291 RepID=UPI001212E129|nr:hypothetical protein [Reyranella sp.]TAJ91047.1 MAG: hypothetical protein EPO50_00525 [Reyranella sp.]
MSQFPKSPDFSLIAGGPLYQLLLRSKLLRPPVGFLERRILVLTLFAWLPLLVLAAMDGKLLPGKGFVPFLYDIEGQVRLLVVLPLLFAAELPVHRRLRHVIRHFIERRIVPLEEQPKFNAIIEQALRCRNSIFLEGAILILAFTVGQWLWRSQIAFGGATWYAAPDGGGGLSLTLPGYWYAFVSIPLFQFVGYRWYMRLVIWAVTLWRISCLKLNLIPTHADRAAGLGFVGNSTYSFTPLLLAHGALLSGWIGERVLQGSSALDFQVEAFVLVCCVVAVIIAPLCVFAAPLLVARRQGRGEYGLLSARYTQAFHEKWIQGKRPVDEPMLGSGDMQSLADLATGYEIVQETRLVPFGLKLPIQLAIITALPLLPLTFTIVSFRSLIMQAVEIIL